MSMDINCDVTKCSSKTVNASDEYNPGEGWRRVTLKTYRHKGGSSVTKCFHFCPKCCKKLGIENVDIIEDPGQTLLDVLYNIMHEAIAE